jgi:hypothetical protein
MPMEKGYHKRQELTMSELGLSLEEFAGQPLELFAKEGAKLLLTVALEEERVKWQKVEMKAEDIAWIEEASKALEPEQIQL